MAQRLAEQQLNAWARCRLRPTSWRCGRGSTAAGWRGAVQADKTARDAGCGDPQRPQQQRDVGCCRPLGSGVAGGGCLALGACTPWKLGAEQLELPLGGSMHAAAGWRWRLGAEAAAGSAELPRLAPAASASSGGHAGGSRTASRLGPCRSHPGPACSPGGVCASAGSAVMTGEGHGQGRRAAGARGAVLGRGASQLGVPAVWRPWVRGRVGAVPFSWEGSWGRSE